MSIKPIMVPTQSALPDSTSARHAFPRSPGGLLATSGAIGDVAMSRSASGLSAQSSSSANSPRPGHLKRRSTDASGGLDYYFSNEAGKRNGPASSSSSSLLSLGISPSPSGGISPLAHPERMRSKSSINLRDLPTPPPLQARPELPHQSSTGPSNRKIQVVSYPSSGDLGAKGESEEGWSDSSDYSNNESSAYSRHDGSGLDSAMSEEYGQRPWDRDRRQESSTNGNGNNDPRASITSGTTYRPDRVEEDFHRTPIPPPTQERIDLKTPRYAPSNKTHSPITHSPIPNTQSTPTRSSSEQSTYTPGSGRLAFVAPFDVSRRSIDALEREVAASSPGRMNVLVNPEPRSAPAWQNEFGPIEGMEGNQDTIKSRNSRNRMTLPSVETSSSGALVEAMLSPEKGMLSPDRYENGRVTPSRGSYDKGSPSKSPEPPPRSNKRTQYASPARDLAPPRTTTPLSISPRTKNKDLPTIINTPHSPDDPSSSSQNPHPRRPERSPDRSPSLTDSATLNDLTEMLGGAIDAIGLIDSRDTPPPTIMEPRKPRERPNLTVGTLEPPAEVDTRPITPNSLPMRGMSLGDSTKTPLQLRKAPSTASVDSVSEFVNTSPTTTVGTNQVTVNVAARPWPAAMLYGHVKGMKNAGDRAKGYARAINDLSRAETGLREWCAASTSTSHRPTLREPAKLSTMSTLGVRPTQTLTVPPPAQHLRNVSTTSEFPMRSDSYSAREITHRVIGNDPSDQPTALPPNLPYPGIQQPNIGAGGMKHSQSMQSVASYASKKGGFFSHMHMRKSGKDKAAPGLGPPTSTISSGGGAVKKDVRALAISGPSIGNGSTSPHTIVDLGSSVGSNSGLSAPRVQQSISAPMGPRNPRMGTFTPPPSAEKSQRGSLDLDPSDTRGRASLDTGLSRLGHGGGSGRNSLDGGVGAAARLGKSSAPPMGMSRGSPIGGGDIRQMMDVLPHVERGVLRGYLGKYGDEMQAIGAYLEDEKAGTVMRA